ncbi:MULTISPECIES: hypothetical protein [unclassified Rhodococcus (in: high G+C Gram-positive bacteria)]|nr:hypothetical protein [Rhodococcus sp. EPR-134]KZF15021.1 hypothetical protein A2J01_32950 [Rhodococcus sp. EPR-134]
MASVVVVLHLIGWGLFVHYDADLRMHGLAGRRAATGETTKNDDSGRSPGKTRAADRDLLLGEHAGEQSR